MVFTQLLLDDSTPELRKFPFGVLAAQVMRSPTPPFLSIIRRSIIFFTLSLSHSFILFLFNSVPQR